MSTGRTEGKGWEVGRDEESWYFDVDGYVVRASPDGDTWLDASVIAVVLETFFIVFIPSPLCHAFMPGKYLYIKYYLNTFRSLHGISELQNEIHK